MIGRIPDRRIVSYGLGADADVRAVDVRLNPIGSEFAVVMRDRPSGTHERLDGLRLPMPGVHNVQNALAAIAVAREMGIDRAVLKRTLIGFRGVARRFSRVGEGLGIAVIDDYAHHPVEIAAALAAARSAYDGRVVAVVQPHRYSRLRDLFEDFCRCFEAADAVLVADIYAAGEEPIPGIDRAALVGGLRDRGHPCVVALDGPEALPGAVADVAGPGDVVVCVGAGSITQWAQALPGQLAALAPARRRAFA